MSKFWPSGTTSALLIGVALSFGMGTLRAQEQPDTVTFGVLGAEWQGDALAGFTTDLVRSVAERAGLDADTQSFTTDAEMLRAFAEGRIDVISDSTGETDDAIATIVHHTRDIRLFYRNVDTSLRVRPTEDWHIGVLDPQIRDELPSHYASADLTVSDHLPDLVLSLLAGDLDAILADTGAVTAMLLATRLETRISPFGDLVLQQPRRMLVQSGNEALRNRIDGALTDLLQDGTVEALKAEWLLAEPPPEPDVLVVGVRHFPPYQVVNSDGSFDGLAVQVLRALAQKIDADLQFVEIGPEDFSAGPTPGTYDILPQAGISPERRRLYDFTRPVFVDEVSIFYRKGTTPAPVSLQDLQDVQVGVGASNIGRKLVADYETIPFTEFQTAADTFDALMSGDVDAAVFTRQAFQELAIAERVTGRLEEAVIEGAGPARAIALRFGLGNVRDRLDAVIPGYLVSKEFIELRNAWLLPPEPWLKRYGIWLIAGLAAALVATGGVVLVVSRWSAARTARVRRGMVADLFEKMPFGISLIEQDGTIRFFNPAYLSLFDRSQDLIRIGANYFDVIREGAERGQYELRDQTLEDWLSYYRRAKSEDGSVYDVHLYDGRVLEGVVSKLADGSTLSMRRDVTAERNAQIQKVALAERLRLVLETATNGIIGLDQDGRIATINPAARHMLGGLNDRTPFDWPEPVKFLDAENLNPLEESADPIKRALAGQSLRGETNLMTRTSGRTNRYVRVSSALTSELSATGIRAVLVIDDVSEQEMNRQQVERSSRLDALGQLTGGIAHDFNNLMATILYALELALLDDLSAQTRGYLNTAIESIRRGSSLTERLLAFAKRQPGRAESRPAQHVLQDFRLLVSPTIEEMITLSFEDVDLDVWVHCDQHQLENALLNLVLNSRDAILRSGQGDRITVTARSITEIDSDVTLRREDPHSYVSKGMKAEHQTERELNDNRAFRYVEIAVTDNGPGMTEEVKRRAIDPFFTTKDSNSGTGLGLSMVYGFVQQSEGELRIYSEEGHGTTVRLLLPRGTSEGAREQPKERLPSPRGQSERILVVEDEENLLRIMEDLILSLDYEILVARSGRDAMQIIEAGEPFDLLLTDIVMPGGVGGFELGRLVRERHPDMPIVYMSGYTGFSEVDMGHAAGQMIMKPCPPHVLANALKTALARESQPPQAD